MSPYAELHTISNYSFLRGASEPGELVARADALGYSAIALTDECSVSGLVRAWVEAKERDIKLITGSEFDLGGGLQLVLLAINRNGYGNLCQIITRGRRNADKGDYRLGVDDLGTLPCSDMVAIWKVHTLSTAAQGACLGTLFGENLWVGVTLDRSGRDAVLLAHSESLAAECGLRRVACGNIHMHHPSRRPLRDTLWAIRLGKPLSELGYRLAGNAEQYLRPRPHLPRLYPDDMLAATVQIAERCVFDPGELRYEYPDDLTPPGYSDATWLRKLTEEGAAARWPDGMSDKVRTQIEDELTLISELCYEPYGGGRK